MGRIVQPNRLAFKPGKIISEGIDNALTNHNPPLTTANHKENTMNKRFVCNSALALMVLLASQAGAWGITNGVIMISTRNPQDTGFSTEYTTDEKGPGMATPGDVAMASLLSDNGYTCRLILDKLLGPAGATLGLAPADTFLQPVNTNMAIGLVIMSGSGASADTPPPPPGVPLMMGEHVCLGNNAGRQGSIFMYNGVNSNDPNESTAPAASKYMKVIAPNHPIMQGIPLDAQGRVKIYREPYPEEELHVPAGGKKNFEYRWCTQAVADKAAGTTILGVLDGAEDRSCFAVMDVGGLDANGAAVKSRLVQLFTNEDGSGGSRRVFLALTEMGRVLFVRAAKWAMGEQLQPYQSLRIINVSPAGAQQIRLSWSGTGKNNYRIQGTTDLINWQTVVDDIPGATNLVMTRTLDISAGPKALFMRIAPLP